VIEQLILVAHVIIALAIIGLILLQQGKGADMGASFGGGGSQTVFGAAGGGSVLTRATAILVAIFFISSFGLAILAKNKMTDMNTSSELRGLESAAEVKLVEETAIPDTEIDLPTDIIQQEGNGNSPLDFVDEIPQ